MPKSRSTVPTLIKTWIALYNTTDETIFTTDGAVVFCQLCEKKIVCSKKFQLQQHADTALHNSALKRRGNEKKNNYLYWMQNRNPVTFLMRIFVQLW